MKMKFGIKGELSDKEFTKILSFSSYKGYLRDKSWFKLDRVKIMRNQIPLSKIKSILNQYGVDIKDISQIKKIEPWFKWISQTKFIATNLTYEQLDELTRFSRPINKWEFELSARDIIESNLSLKQICTLYEQFGRLPNSTRRWIKSMIDLRQMVWIRERRGKLILKTKARIPLSIYWDKGWIRQVRNEIQVVPAFLEPIKRDLISRGLLIHDQTCWKQKIPLPSEFKTSLSLRPYQVKALNHWIGEKEGIISLPAGTGKSIIGLKAIEILQECTLIVVPTKDLINDWIQKFKDFSNYEISIYPSTGPITITTYQAAWRHVRELRPNFSFLILDEAHRVSFERFWNVCLKFPAEKRLGLTGTPWREDGTKEILFPLVGGICYEESINHFKGKQIADFEIETIRVRLTKEEKRRYLSLIRSFRKFAKGSSLKKITRTNPSIMSYLSNALKILRDAKEKYEKVRELVDDKTPTIVFCLYIDQANRIAKQLGTEVLSSEVPDWRRRELYHQFREGEIKTIVATPCLDEGVDFPDAVKGIIVASRGGSRVQLLQRLGRLLRPKESKAKLYIIIVGNSPEEGWLNRAIIPLSS